jgi:5'-methylthioinosine phosphorylase
MVGVMTGDVIGIIGGTGLNKLATAVRSADRVDTPFGAASAVPQVGEIGARTVIFLARHGQPHRIAPHLINYRANVWLLRELGASLVLATNAVGSIANAMAPGDLMLPHQIIDYTWGREHTYTDTLPLQHVDFSVPYDAALRDRLRVAALELELNCSVFNAGVYGCTQGPRLESAAEIDRMARDGCDVVGMTGMPEAGLARELALPYATVCLSVNRAAGRGDGPISEAEIVQVAETGMHRVERLIARFIELS